VSVTAEAWAVLVMALVFAGLVCALGVVVTQRDEARYLLAQRKVTRLHPDQFVRRDCAACGWPLGGQRGRYCTDACAIAEDGEPHPS